MPHDDESPVPFASLTYQQAAEVLRRGLLLESAANPAAGHYEFLHLAYRILGAQVGACLRLLLARGAFTTEEYEAQLLAEMHAELERLEVHLAKLGMKLER